MNHTFPATTGDQSYEQKEREDLCRRMADFFNRFGYVPDFRYASGQAAPLKPAIKRDLFDLAQAAEYLRISPRKLKDLCRDGRITHDRLDYRTYRFSQESLEAYLAQYRMLAR